MFFNNGYTDMMELTPFGLLDVVSEPILLTLLFNVNEF